MRIALVFVCLALITTVSCKHSTSKAESKSIYDHNGNGLFGPDGQTVGSIQNRQGETTVINCLTLADFLTIQKTAKTQTSTELTETFKNSNCRFLFPESTVRYGVRYLSASEIITFKRECKNLDADTLDKLFSSTTTPYVFASAVADVERGVTACYTTYSSANK